jgi:hypothetical protein
MNKLLFYTLLLIACISLLASCITNKPLYTKKARWLPGNAKHFQQRHDLKLKRQAIKDSANKNLQP